MFPLITVKHDSEEEDNDADSEEEENDADKKIYNLICIY